jgi:hypothetical protein
MGKILDSSVCRFEGLAFSLLVILDGGTDLPGFKLSPDPHPSDKEFNQKRGENWFPKDCDIAGELHELFRNFKPEGK